MDSSQHERELVVQAGRGDADAFGRLVGLYEKRVYNMAKSICGNAEDALDISQEVFFKAWRGLPAFRGDSSFSTWLFRLTSNVCTDHMRKISRRLELPLVMPSGDGHPGNEDIPDARYDPESVLETSDLRRALDSALEKLSPQHRTVLAMRENAGMTYEEIAAALGVEDGTVKSRIARARAQMRQYLLEDGNFPGLSSSNQTKGR